MKIKNNTVMKYLKTFHIITAAIWFGGVVCLSGLAWFGFLVACTGIGSIGQIFLILEKIKSNGFTGGFTDGSVVLLFMAAQILIMIFMMSISVLKPFKKKSACSSFFSLSIAAACVVCPSAFYFDSNLSK